MKRSKFNFISPASQTISQSSVLLFICPCLSSLHCSQYVHFSVPYLSTGEIFFQPHDFHISYVFSHSLSLSFSLFSRLFPLGYITKLWQNTPGNKSSCYGRFTQRGNLFFLKCSRFKKRRTEIVERQQFPSLRRKSLTSAWHAIFGASVSIALIKYFKVRARKSARAATRCENQTETHLMKSACPVF